MNQYRIIIPKENAWEVVNEFGNIGCLHFLDLSSGEMQADKNCHLQLKHCHDMLGKVSRMMDFVVQEDREVTKVQDYGLYVKNRKSIVRSSGATEKSYISRVEAEVDRLYGQMTTHREALDRLLEDLRKTEEERYVLLSFKLPITREYMYLRIKKQLPRRRVWPQKAERGVKGVHKLHPRHDREQRHPALPNQHASGVAWKTLHNDRRHKSG